MKNKIKNKLKINKIVANFFPTFTLCDCSLMFVNKFKYLGHVIDNSFSYDSDINREIKALFIVGVFHDVHWL